MGMLFDLFEVPNEDNDAKLYKREKLKRLPISENKAINFKKSNILELKFGSEKMKQFYTPNLSHLYFSFYKCESVDDRGWGCAWRSMQSALKYQLSLTNQNRDKEISFYKLFMKYGDKNMLIDIFMRMKKDQDISDVLNKLLNKKFAAHETDCGWAEPFISQLVLYDFGFEGELILINGYSNHNYAPEEVFSRALNFKEFRELLRKYFKQENPGPIIIDDSYSSLSIIGVSFDDENQNTELIIMDPHTVEYPENGLYIIKLNEEGGFLEVIPNEHVLCSRSVKFSDNKPWMAYIPTIKSIN